MGNPITNELPEEVDNLLQDTAQMYGGFGYLTIMRFAEVCTKEDIKKLSKIAQFFEDSEGDVTQKQIDSYSEKVVKIVTNRMKKHPQVGWRI